MGPSMSNPDIFRQRNKQRHLQAYQRKYRTEISLDSKIKLKNVSQFVPRKHQQTSQPKTVMKRQQKQIQPDQILTNIKKKSLLNQQAERERIETPINKVLSQQISAEIPKINPNSNLSKYDIKSTRPQEVSVMNSASKQMNTRKIVLNNQSYQIDIEKMKNRRLRSKQRYTNSILSNQRNISKINGFHTKPSASTNSVALGVSSLQLQSQLHPILLHNNISQSEQENLLENISGQPFERVLYHKDIYRNQNQQVRAEYYEQYSGNFESKESRKYQQKLKQSKSDSKLFNANFQSKTEKTISRKQFPSEYYIQSEKQIKSKKSEYITSPNQTYRPLETALSQSQQNNKKPLKIIKVLKK